MDSFLEVAECCKTFPDKHKFCWEYDANYCQTCFRWLESPHDSLLRPEKHIDCQNSFCAPQPIQCVCGHSDRKHRKSFLLNELMGLSQEGINLFLTEFWNSSNKCDACECKVWTPDPNGPTD